MHPALIKASLQMTQPPTRQADIAKQCGVSAVTVHDVVHGRRRCKRVEVRIAATIGLPLADIWPQWHGPKVTRKQALRA